MKRDIRVLLLLALIVGALGLSACSSAVQSGQGGISKTVAEERPARDDAE